MPSRNAKIIVSASLMVAMVLPVSVATFVQASNEPNNQPAHQAHAVLAFDARFPYIAEYAGM